MPTKQRDIASVCASWEDADKEILASALKRAHNIAVDHSFPNLKHIKLEDILKVLDPVFDRYGTASEDRSIVREAVIDTMERGYRRERQSQT